MSTQNVKLSWKPPDISSKTAVYNWGVDYASVVHNGAFGDGIRIFPRPWVYRTVSRNDVLSLFADHVVKTKDFNKAFTETVQDLEFLFTDAIESSDWQYPTITTRKNGETVGSPRDVVDLGNLRDSLTVTIS